jgi:hypothetical protein
MASKLEEAQRLVSTHLGKLSAKKRFAGMTPEQISEKMKLLRKKGTKKTSSLKTK